MVNIDTVYQKVLTLANKEQRGYVTPQEFNLLANKAQLDLFNNYFHNMKTGYQKPLKNQTEGFDEMEMLKEKLGWLNRTQETSTVFETWGNINKTIVYIPTDCYKIASIYLKGVGDRLYEDPWTINTANQIDEVEIKQVSRSELKLMNGNHLTKPNIKRPVGVLYDTGHLMVNYGGGGGSYLELHPAVEMMSWYYDNGLSTDDDDFASSTLWSLASSDSGDTSGDVGKITGGIDQSVKETLDYVPEWGGFTTYGSTVVFDYYRKPIDPHWGYVIVNGKALYNSNASVDFDLHPSEEEPLVIRILELAGITIQKPQLQQAAIVDKSSTKQEQND